VNFNLSIPNPINIHIHNLDLSEVKVELRKLMDLIIQTKEATMATKQEVKADMAEVLKEVTETRGAAQSAIAWAKGLMDQIGEAAANAADLDAFRADLALIKAETQATEDELKAAIPANP
jgi:hypothetical protein